MNTRRHMRSAFTTLGLFLALALVSAGGQTIQDPPVGRPDAVIDLASHEGVQLVNGQWRYHEVKIVDADSRAVGPDLKPSGAPTKTYDYAPHAEPIAFDDSRWEAIDATTLDQRRSTAKVCFNWYRINVTIPEKVANFSTAGSTVAFEIVIDDYAEVWINGKMPRVLGQPGGPVIKGFNAPNRVILTRNAQPGQRIQLAVFGINGPISFSPQNFIWIKSATLDFYKSPKVAISETAAQVMKKDPALDEIVPAGAKIEKLAGGFLFTEGPRLPSFQRSQQQPDIPLDTRRATVDLHDQERLPRHGHRRVRSTRFQRSHARQAGTAHNQPARQPARGPNGEERPAYFTGRPLRGQAAQ